MPLFRAIAAGPLAGLRVVDCSTVLAGPYCTMLLGDLGADVIKVEPPDGDATRGWGPPWVGSERPRAPGPPRTTWRSTGTSAASGSTSRRRTASAVLDRLLERGDVLVENFRVGGFARLGFDDDDAPRGSTRALVHLAISGFGPDGPSAALPGYDFVIQAMSGLMSITGAADAEGGRADEGRRGDQRRRDRHARRGRRPGGAPGRDRDGATGRGPRAADRHLAARARRWPAWSTRPRTRSSRERSPERLGNAHPNIVPYETFETADDPIAVAVGSERQWQRSLRGPRAAGAGRRPALRVQRRSGRSTASALRPILADRFRRTRRRRLARRARCRRDPVRPDQRRRPCLRVGRGDGARHDRRADAPGLGRRSARSACRSGCRRRRRSIRTPPPALGEHTDEILGWLGYDRGGDRVASRARGRLSRSARVAGHRASGSRRCSRPRRPRRIAERIDDERVHQRVEALVGDHEQLRRALGRSPSRSAGSR